MEQLDKMYSKLLVARNSPKNGCYVEDGHVLIVLSKNDVKLKDQVVHYFIDGYDKKTKSKYGWVRSVEQFSIGQFMNRYSLSTDDEQQVAHIGAMLESASRFPDDTPMAATYSRRGVEKKVMEFTVHKVFFYKG